MSYPKVGRNGKSPSKGKSSKGSLYGVVGFLKFYSCENGLYFFSTSVKYSSLSLSVVPNFRPNEVPDALRRGDLGESYVI